MATPVRSRNCKSPTYNTFKTEIKGDLTKTQDYMVTNNGQHTKGWELTRVRKTQPKHLCFHPRQYH
jgi:hypothetical protein